VNLPSFAQSRSLARSYRPLTRRRHGETEERWGQKYAMQKGAPFAMPRKTFLDPEGSLGER